jgi:hypothetical protein
MSILGVYIAVNFNINASQSLCIKPVGDYSGLEPHRTDFINWIAAQWVVHILDKLGR